MLSWVTPPDAPLPHGLVERVLIDARAQIRAGARPRRFLDDAAIHVDDVERAVGRSRHVDRAEKRIGRLDELVPEIRVAKLREPLGHDRLHAADDAADRLAVNQVALQIGGEAIAAIDVVAGGAGHAVERTVGHAHGAHAGLHVRDAHRRAPRNLEVPLELFGDGEAAVVDGELEERRQAARAALEPHLAVVVLRRAPLRAVRRGRLAPDAGRRPAHAERVDRAVQPVVHRRVEERLLVLDVAGSAERAREERLLFRDAVAIRVGELPHLVGIRLHRQHAVAAEGQDEAREHELVDEDGVLLVDAVVVGVFVPRDAADGIELAARVLVLHVAAQLEDEHAAVAVERDRARLLDVGVAQNRRDLVSGRKNELLGLISGREGNDGGAGREVGVGIGGVSGGRLRRNRGRRGPGHPEARAAARQPARPAGTPTAPAADRSTGRRSTTPRQRRHRARTPPPSTTRLRIRILLPNGTGQPEGRAVCRVRPWVLRIAVTDYKKASVAGRLGTSRESSYGDIRVSNGETAPARTGSGPAVAPATRIGAGADSTSSL